MKKKTVRTLSVLSLLAAAVLAALLPVFLFGGNGERGPAGTFIAVVLFIAIIVLLRVSARMLLRRCPGCDQTVDRSYAVYCPHCGVELDGNGDTDS